MRLLLISKSARTPDSGAFVLHFIKARCVSSHFFFFLIQMQHTNPTVMPSAMRKITWCLHPKAFNSSRPVVFSLRWHGNGSNFVIEKEILFSNKSCFEGSFLGALLLSRQRPFVICLMKVFITVLLKNRFGI